MTDNKKAWGGMRQGAGRFSIYQGEDKKKITLSLTEKAIEILNKNSKKTGYSRSDILNKLILTYLDINENDTESVKQINEYPVYDEATDIILRYMTEQEASEELIEEIAHDNIVKIRQDKKGKLSFLTKEAKGFHWHNINPKIKAKKGFIGKFTPIESDIISFESKELLAAQYALNAGTNYYPTEDVYVTPFMSRWKTTNREQAERSVTLIIFGKEETYHFKRIWINK